MFVFEIKAYSGHIQDVMREAHKIAIALPHNEFILNFNERIFTINPEMDWQDNLQAYCDRYSR